MMNEHQLINLIAQAIIPTLFAITVHEFSHGYVAYQLGDGSAKMLGRLTLNPIKHIDGFGTVIVPLAMLMMSGFVFGWAKPVPVNTRALSHLRRDMSLIAIAGPLSNLVMAILWALYLKCCMMLSDYLMTLETNQIALIVGIGDFGVKVNLILMAVNLIPILPLDGGRVLAQALPRRIAYYYDQIEPYGIVIVVIALYFGLLNSFLIGISSASLSIIQLIL
tara:strand:- start:916 stop:1578 length:663 start_codon:yes stop_codon:yes gene_type:complete